MRRLIICLIISLLPVLGYSQGYGYKGGVGKGNPYGSGQEQVRSWSGSGIAIGKRQIATNHHVIEGATNMYVSLSGSDVEYRAETVVSDPENDLAIIKITDDQFPGFVNAKYGFKKETEDVGMGVFVLGYPMVSSMGSEIKLTTGVVSSRSGFGGNMSQYQISAPVQPGNSGGPLFNDNGELIGIISSKHLEAENVSYGVKLNYLCSLAEGVDGVDLEHSSEIANLSLSEKCKAVIPFTVMIKADNFRTSSTSKGSAKPEGHPFSGTPSERPSGKNGGYPIHINNPDVAQANDQFTNIFGVELTESYTAVYMSLTNNQHETAYFNVSQDIYITDARTGEKYRLVTTENCAIHPSKSILNYGSTAQFALFFEPLPADAASFNMIEPGDNGWKFYGIGLK